MDIPEHILPCPYCRIIIRKLEPSKVYTQNEIAELVKNDMSRKTALLHINELFRLNFLEDHAIHKKPKQIMLNTFTIALEITKSEEKIREANPLSSFSPREQLMIREVSKAIRDDLKDPYDEILTKLMQIDRSILISVLHLLEKNLDIKEINLTPDKKTTKFGENVVEES